MRSNCLHLAPSSSNSCHNFRMRSASAEASSDSITHCSGVRSSLIRSSSWASSVGVIRCALLMTLRHSCRAVLASHEPAFSGSRMRPRCWAKRNQTVEYTSCASASESRCARTTDHTSGLSPSTSAFQPAPSPSTADWTNVPTAARSTSPPLVYGMPSYAVEGGAPLVLRIVLTWSVLVRRPVDLIWRAGCSRPAPGSTWAAAVRVRRLPDLRELGVRGEELLAGGAGVGLLVGRHVGGDHRGDHGGGERGAAPLREPLEPHLVRGARRGRPLPVSTPRCWGCWQVQA